MTMKDFSERTNELLELKDGWLGGEGVAIDKKMMNKIRTKFQNFYVENGILIPSIFPLVDGGLNFEWETENWYLEVVVYNNSLVHKMMVMFNNEPNKDTALYFNVDLYKKSGWVFVYKTLEWLKSIV